MAQPSIADLESLIRQQNNEVEKLRETVEDLKKMMKGLMQQNLQQNSPRVSFPVEQNDHPRNRRSSERILHRDPSKTFLLRNVPFSEIEEACHNWSKILGVGGFGEVYQGTWNGQNVAVKRLRNDKRPSDIKGKMILTHLQRKIDLFIFNYFSYDNMVNRISIFLDYRCWRRSIQ